MLRPGGPSFATTSALLPGPILVVFRGCPVMEDKNLTRLSIPSSAQHGSCSGVLLALLARPSLRQAICMREGMEEEEA